MKKPMILATALTALLAVPFAHAEDLPGKGVKITPVQSIHQRRNVPNAVSGKSP